VNDTPRGCGYYKKLAGLFNRVGLWRVERKDSIVDKGYCLANPGVEYVVYQPEKREFTVKVDGAKGDLAAE
jgi:hypothetical protein